MFQIGEYVVYGAIGVCQVEAIGSMCLSGVESDKDYYTLNPLYAKRSKVYTPVDNQKVKMRSVMSEAEAYSLIDEMKDVELIDVVDDKHREHAYKESMKSCECRELVRVMNTVLRRKEERQALGKKMSACDERYLKQAQDGLYGELAVSLGIEKNDVEDFIEHRLCLRNMASAS